MYSTRKDLTASPSLILYTLYQQNFSIDTLNFWRLLVENFEHTRKRQKFKVSIEKFG